MKSVLLWGSEVFEKHRAKEIWAMDEQNLDAML